MWHLILPPLVVIACAILILWYVALRGSDPEVVKRADAIIDTQENTLKVVLRGFFLRVVEKLAQRFKVLSLRVHNGLHDVLQSVKEKRKLSDLKKESPEITAVARQGEEIVENFEGEAEEEKLFSLREDLRQEQVPVSTMVSEKTPAFNISVPLRRRKRDEVIPRVSVPEISVRPMVSARAVEPEKPKRKSVTRPAEEGLIARIALNPKDYTAYESLGDFYMEQGSIQDAKECYRQVLKLSPVQRMVKLKIRRLERLLAQKQG